MEGVARSGPPPSDATGVRGGEGWGVGLRALSHVTRVVSATDKCEPKACSSGVAIQVA